VNAAIPARLVDGAATSVKGEQRELQKVITKDVKSLLQQYRPLMGNVHFSCVLQPVGKLCLQSNSVQQSDT